MDKTYVVKDVTFNTDPQNLVDEINALKAALAVSIFSQSPERALLIIKSLKQNQHPAIQKMVKELLQFSPANAEEAK
ncbi:hypothetical protein JAG44_001165 [Citrobacter koseri]|nr:hypothetical protein [Citrobacter koseri]HEM6832045.1 hypothetical protein [Citrobacter koseri]HEM8556207.1 hypothetical protein [Citrobacter koseri]